MIDRKIQYVEDRTESFDDYFPCKRKICKLIHLRNWLNLFAICHNKAGINAIVNNTINNPNFKIKLSQNLVIFTLFVIFQYFVITFIMANI